MAKLKNISTKELRKMQEDLIWARPVTNSDDVALHSISGELKRRRGMKP